MKKVKDPRPSRMKEYAERLEAIGMHMDPDAAKLLGSAVRGVDYIERKNKTKEVSIFIVPSY